jgi:hypothetical protein
MVDTVKHHETGSSFISFSDNFDCVVSLYGTGLIVTRDNPIAVEVAWLIEGHTENFRAHVERLGYIPASFLHVKPQTAIEAAAMRLTTEAIQETISGYVA